MKHSEMTSADIEQLLRNRFCPPAWAFIPQVRSGTGFVSAVRTADAIAMGLWPSRGLHLYGFEIKIYRNDWLKELMNPAKAEEIASFCDFWWVVAPKDIVKIEEVPASWGLMIPHGSTTKIVKQAEQLKPQQIDKLFLAAILRRAQETIAPEVKISDAFKEGEKKGEEKINQNFEYERRQHQSFKDTVATFEKASGVRIADTWCLEDIGAAVRMVADGEHLNVKKQLEYLLTSAKNIVTNIENNLKE